MKYEIFNKIEDDCRLASVLNKAMESLGTARIISAPRFFDDMNREKDHTFCQLLVFEKYLKEAVWKLHQWDKLIGEYMKDFEGSWEYYARSKRIDSIKKYGGGGYDYNEDGSIRKDVSKEVLLLYTIPSDLYQEGVGDIVFLTKPKDLWFITRLFKVNAELSFKDIFKNAAGVDIPTSHLENGKIVKDTWIDDVENKACRQLDAESYVAIVLFVSFFFQNTIYKIKQLKPDQDNKEDLLSIWEDIRQCIDFNNEFALKYSNLMDNEPETGKYPF